MIYHADFHIEYPDSWSPVDRFTPVAFRCASPLLIGARDVATVIIFHFKGVDQPREYFRRGVAKLSGRFAHFELLETDEILTKDVHLFKVRFMADGESPQSREQHEHQMHLGPRRSYVLEAKCRDVDYELYAREIDAILKSFKLIEPKQGLQTAPA
ncbi:MAG TPA: hypothetical protein VKX17_01025 [Planctomycetota bacterium]|nr:hypothetical protein [Planctomycetota bacterium]